MLKELRVRNFAIIDDLHVAFQPGFNVLTGETGAGKSIIIDAIELLLGGKANQTSVRAGADLASIEGIFELSGEVGAAIEQQLQSEGLESEDNWLILARDIRRGGRSVARINGRAVSQRMLAEIGGQLVDIHGQGEHLSLLHVRTHIDLLDRYAGLFAQRERITNMVGELNRVRRTLETLRRDARETARRIDLLTYQINEISSAALSEGEEERLLGERRRLANAEELASQTAAISTLLDAGSEETPPALDLVGDVVARLEKLAAIDEELTPLLSQAQELFEQMSDMGRAVAHYANTIAYDPERLQEVEERLELIYQLKRKYGDTIGEIIQFGEKAQEELEQLAQSETQTEALEAEEDRLLHAIGEAAAQLSAARQQAAQALAAAIEEELGDLRMGGARVAVEIEQHPDERGCFINEERFAFDATGIDKVQFLVSANPGEPLLPLAKVASGGETARLMLALKNVLSRADNTPTLIFDEIDQGIGGRVGAIVGRKLADLARSHQVLCVTHLPQIAAYGDYHLAVVKRTEGERTVTRLQVLKDTARIEELAAMLGTPTVSGRQSAQELLAEVKQWREG
ncbi:MAG: DNA repair protein RecN [Chloroflexi bacterium]|nr:DNA repair protein RecN [Chloroflexota bacterium]